MITNFRAILATPYLIIYLKLLALFYSYGAIVHFANLLGWGELPWQEMPLSWKLGDIVYGISDPITVVGLWLNRGWGVAMFIAAALSQLILYLGFPQVFAFTLSQQQALTSLIIFHLVTLGIFVILFWVSSATQDQR